VAATVKAKMSVVTRFAPSPTGFLHIGSARTALFNWLFARHHGGRFLLRIEDTDRARSTQPAVDAILDGLQWLELQWDGEVLFQFARAARHAEVARQLLAEGKAYRCYCSPAELEAMRAQAKAEGRTLLYDGRWRDRDPKEAPPGVKPVIRFKAPREGATVIRDLVQGEVTVANDQLDDLIILRADGTPTYNWSVIVDDHDMGITHVIRGDDHLTNAFRQTQLYLACGFGLPQFAHIPLIHGADGAKLSKRHGALGVDAYRDMGYLPAAVRNYLLRLGWSHGDDEVISTEQAVAWFNLASVGRSPSRFDFTKLESLNGSYIRQTDNKALAEAAMPFLAKLAGRTLSQADHERLLRAMPSLKDRAKSLVELAEKAAFLVAARPLAYDAAALKQFGPETKTMLTAARARLAEVAPWDAANTEAAIRNLAEATGRKLGAVAQPLRAALTGKAVSPPIFDVLAVLGREESLGRLDDALTRS
jgi:glutamyl-tRNA synthetase